MDLQVQLRSVREKFTAASDEQDTLLAGAETEDRSLNQEEQEKFDALESDKTDYHARMKNLEKRLKVNEFSPDLNDDIGLTGEERQRFSLRKLIRAMALPGERQAQEDAKFEMECSSAVAEKRKAEPKGVYIPAEVFQARNCQGYQARATHQVSAEAANLVETMLAEEEFIEILRNRSVLIASGAEQLPNLIGNMAIPKKTGGSTAEWQATETTDINESNVTLAQVSLTPKTVGVHTSVSRQALIQTTPAMDRILEDDMRAELGLAVDLAGLYGTGAGGQPLGLANIPGIGAPAAFAAAIPTWPELMAMVAEAAAGNAVVSLGGDSDELGSQTMRWLLEGVMAANLMAVEKFATTGQTIIDSEGRVGPWGAMLSNQVTLGDVIFGDFANFIIGTWGGLDLIVDPYSQSQKGVTRMTVFQAVDVAVRHPEAFVLNNDTP